MGESASRAGLTLSAALCVGVMAGGCGYLLVPVAVGVGEATVMAYRRGTRTSYVDAPVLACARAVREVAARYHLREADCAVSDGVWQLRCLNTEDVPFEIRLTPLTAGCSRLEMRVGVWGDEACSAKLMDDIRRAAQRPRATAGTGGGDGWR